MPTSASYSSQTDLSHRKKFGQFFTPAIVAQFMAKWLVDNKSKNYLDPAFGLGVFAEELNKLAKVNSFQAYELDKHIYNFSKKHFSKKVSLFNKDYLQTWGKSTVDAIICNPPYMKFQNFHDKDGSIAKIEKNLGIKLSGYTNTASAFLLKSVFELAENGRLAYIMPFEFMNAGYGEIVKEYLLKNGEVEAFIQIDCEKETFSEVITSVGIIFFQKKKKPTKDIPFFVVNDLKDLAQFKKLKPIKSVSRKEISSSDKWAKYFSSHELELNHDRLTTLNTYGHFSRGIATGANEYFSFSQSKAKKNSLPQASLIPCITKSNQIKASVFEKSDLDALVNSEASVFLVNLEMNSESKSVQKYIALGEKELIHERYLTKMRSPWYKLEKRKPSGLLFGVFSRNGYKVIRNNTDAISLTCYHGFNLKAEYEQYVDLLFFYLLSEAGKKILQINMRKYGDGLDKFEPNDLNNSLVPTTKWFSSLKNVNIKEEFASVKKTGKITSKLNSIFDELILSN